jgi:hypothetical protein
MNAKVVVDIAIAILAEVVDGRPAGYDEFIRLEGEK